MHAIIETGGKQYRVAPGDVIRVEQLAGDVGSEIEFPATIAFQEGGENDPVNQLAAYHVDISSPAFGIQEENHFPDVVREILPGTAEIRKGYLYWSGKPGLGVDVDEKAAAKYPIREITNGAAWPLERTMDGAVVKP